MSSGGEVPIIETDIHTTELDYLITQRRVNGDVTIVHLPYPGTMNYLEEEVDLISPDIVLQRALELQQTTVSVIIPKSWISFFQEYQGITFSTEYDGFSDIVIDIGYKDNYIELETGHIIKSPIRDSQTYTIPISHLYYRFIGSIRNIPYYNSSGVLAYLKKREGELDDKGSEIYQLFRRLGYTRYAALSLETLLQQYNVRESVTFIALIDIFTSDFIPEPKMLKEEIPTEYRIRLGKFRESLGLLSPTEPEAYWKAWHEKQDIINPLLVTEVKRLIEDTIPLLTETSTRKLDISVVLEILRTIYPKYSRKSNFYEYKNKLYTLTSWNFSNINIKRPDFITVLAEGKDVITSSYS